VNRSSSIIVGFSNTMCQKLDLLLSLGIRFASQFALYKELVSILVYETKWLPSACSASLHNMMAADAVLLTLCLKKSSLWAK